MPQFLYITAMLDYWGQQAEHMETRTLKLALKCTLKHLNVSICDQEFGGKNFLRFEELRDSIYNINRSSPLVQKGSLLFNF